MSCEWALALAGRGLVLADRRVGAADCQALAVRGKGHGVDRHGIALEEVARPWLGPRQVPEAQDAVLAAGSQRLAVRGEGDRVDVAQMAPGLETLGRFGAAHVP